MKKQVKRHRTPGFAARICAACLVAGMLLQLPATAALPGTLTALAAQKTDYSRYSSAKHDWYIRRAKNHEKAGGGIPAGIKLSDYDSYYMNVKTDEKVIYLSFDCGYENGYTDQILKTLKKHKAKAVFFVTKDFIKKAPKLVTKMKEQGHLVGNHTCTHPDLSQKSPEQIKKELVDCEKAMKDATGYEMDPFLRPPMGCFSERSLKVAQDLGYKTIFWSMAYYDYDADNQPGKDYVVKHFKDNYHKGALPLIHATSSSNCEALDEVLTFLEGKKYRFGTLDEFALPKGTLKISCKSKVYDGKPAKIKIVKNTNKNATVTFTIKNEKGKRVKEAIEPGAYTVVAHVESSRTYRFTTSNRVRFRIQEKLQISKGYYHQNEGKHTKK